MDFLSKALGTGRKWNIHKTSEGPVHVNSLQCGPLEKTSSALSAQKKTRKFLKILFPNEVGLESLERHTDH